MNYINVVQLTARLDMWIDDEGLLTEQPINGLPATLQCGTASLGSTTTAPFCLWTDQVTRANARHSIQIPPQP